MGGVEITVQNAVVLAIRLFSYSMPLLTPVMNASMAMYSGSKLFSMEFELPKLNLLLNISNVAFFFVGTLPIDHELLKSIADSKEFYKPVALIILTIMNLVNLITTFVIMDVVILNTKTKIKHKVEQIRIYIEDLDEVIQLWITTDAVLAVPVLMIFTTQQLLSTLVVYVFARGKIIYLFLKKSLKEFKKLLLLFYIIGVICFIIQLCILLDLQLMIFLAILF